jgi:uncharacterized damage-inducible protein DinB
MDEALYNHLHHQLLQLSQVISRLENHLFVAPSQYLSGATIGQHSRHVVELVQCLYAGYASGQVNYDNRNRDVAIETNPKVCIAAIDALIATTILSNKAMQLQSELTAHADPNVIDSTWQRELVYNIEHTTHHMALIKVALIEFGITDIPNHFGYAHATIKHLQQCAQ